MKQLQLKQGSPEWLAHRASHFNASDAPAMMGVSPYKTRSQLLKELHTGLSADVDAGTQRLYDDGHRAEALARPLAESIIGDDLYPVVGTEGKLSASFDGLTMMEDVNFEHKLLNAALREAMVEGCTGADLPMVYQVQMEHQHMVSSAERTLFMASKWDAEGNLIEERHCWYTPNPELAAKIAAGWDQFERDLCDYVLPEPAAAPAAAGRVPDTLPALRIEVTGAVTASNLAEFKQTALTAIRSVNRALKTDQDFADAAKAVKWCEDIESRIKAAKEHALSQTESIDALFKALDDITGEAKLVRLDLDKLVTRRKTEVKEEAVVAARRALEQHIADLQAELAPMRLQPVAADFPAAIKGLRSIASMQDALDTTLAGAKIAADSQARGIRANLVTFKAKASAHEFLFVDLAQLVHKAGDDFAAVVDQRITAHKAAEAEKEEKRQAAADRAAAEKLMAAAYEAAKARVGHDRTYVVYLQFSEGHGNKVPLEKTNEYIAALGALQPEPNTPVQDPQQVLKAEPATPETTDRDAPASTSPSVGSMGVRATADAAPSVGFARVVHPAAQALRNELPTLKLGTIGERLGFPLTADFLASIGFSTAATERGAKLYHERDFGAICTALIDHVDAVRVDAMATA